MSAIWIVLGVVVLVVTLGDAIDTLISTRIRVSGRWPTDLFLRATWAPLWRLAPRIRHESRREALLSAYGPLSVIGLLAVWTAGQILGWALIWRGLRGSFGGLVDSLGDALYFSGIVYGTVGFGDITPATGFARFLTVVEAFSGLATMGLVIGFLPSLYASYQARETKLLLLDDLADRRITPMSLVASLTGPQRDPRRLDGFFDEWSRWTAELFESHASFPMLMFFRSKYRGSRG